MAEPAGPFHALWHGGHQYLCYCAAPHSSGFNVYVTNASEVWSTDFTLEKLESHKSQSGMCPSEDYSTKFREAFEHRAAALTVHDSKATLQLKEAAEDAAAAAASCSPEKNQLQSQRLLIPDLSPRKNRGGGSAVTAKRRVPGESLINPGFKSSLPVRRHRPGWILKTPDPAWTPLMCVPLMKLFNELFRLVYRLPVNVQPPATHRV
ncbi:protein PAXX isoform X2 [Mauremys mutica]|uniref:protein PAXX isoform X2 n=1 Tax=Mauremys mutica TaxID=74926 RepID=UPI001D16C8BC|nr:protein PAXX isoform X2 [Mauremys mutica]